MTEEGPITMNTIKALLPIVTSIIMVVFSWGSLNTKIDLTIQKLDNIAQAVQEIKQERKESISKMELKVNDRDRLIAQIQQELTRIKTIINFENRQ